MDALNHCRGLNDFQYDFEVYFQLPFTRIMQGNSGLRTMLLAVLYALTACTQRLRCIPWHRLLLRGGVQIDLAFIRILEVVLGCIGGGQLGTFPYALNAEQRQEGFACDGSKRRFMGNSPL